MLPDGLTYVGSWVETNFDRCFQLMECDDARLLQQWATRWHGLDEFEFVPRWCRSRDRGGDRAPAVGRRGGERTGRTLEEAADLVARARAGPA